MSSPEQSLFPLQYDRDPESGRTATVATRSGSPIVRRYSCWKSACHLRRDKRIVFLLVPNAIDCCGRPFRFEGQPKPGDRNRWAKLSNVKAGLNCPTITVIAYSFRRSSCLNYTILSVEITFGKFWLAREHCNFKSRGTTGIMDIWLRSITWYT